MSYHELMMTAQALVAPGKGILAADESHATIGKRFQKIGISNSESTRRDYREILFSAPKVSDYISGVILYDETLRQKSADGTPFVELLKKRGMIPGIKVDLGAKDLAGCPGEKITEGLDGLRERFQEYSKLGARFAKWRAVLNVADGIPSDTCLIANAEALARYAALAQEQSIVPIVEPEVIMDGAHSMERCEEFTTKALLHVFSKLREQRVLLEGVLLKPNMVLPGSESGQQPDQKTVAERTVRTLRRCVPAAVPGIVFLSGGQSDELATAHLNAMNASFPHLPWQLSFSYGRALQTAALKIWAGKADKIEDAGAAFAHRARLNSAARYGTYAADMES